MVNFDKFKLRVVVHNKHARATSNLGQQSQHLLEDRGKPRKPVSKWPVTGPFGFAMTSGQQFRYARDGIPLHKWCPKSQAIRDHFAGDPWIHFCNGYFDVHFFLI